MDSASCSTRSAGRAWGKSSRESAGPPPTTAAAARARRRGTPRSPRAGAAGGAGAGLIAFLGARLVPGAPLVVDASGFDAALSGASLLITGEGRVDAQTAYGKAPGEVAKRARAAGVPVLLLAGSKGPG